MSETLPLPSIEGRRAWLAELTTREDVMLAELAQVIGAAADAGLKGDPVSSMEKVARFVDATDFRDATEDARIWLLNRLGLFVARWFITRYGGALTVQANPSQRFYLHFVVTGMRSPISLDARLDPFAIAHDAINASPKLRLIDLIQAAERNLLNEAG